MSLGHSPSIVTNGLVMYYDMNNTQKSWLGKPTTNYVDPKWVSWGIDGSGQATLGTRTILSIYDCIITDAVSNTRQSIFVLGLSASTAYTFSVKFKRIGGAPTLRFQLQSYNGATALTSVFPTTIQIGLIDIDGWQTASYTYTTAVGADRVLWFMQDGDDYTTYTHSFQLKEPQTELGSFATPFVDGARSTTQALVDLTNKNTLTATSLTYASNNTFSFNGTSDAVSLGNVLSRNTAGQTLSMSLWIYPTRTTCYIIGRGQTNANYGQYSLIIDAGSLRLSIFNSVAGYHYYTLGTISANTWSHIALSHTFGTGASTLSTINGVSGGSWTTGDGSAVSDQASTSLEIGHWYGTPSATSNAYWFAGNITNVAVYDRAITINEMKQNFNALRGRYSL